MTRSNTLKPLDGSESLDTWSEGRIFFRDSAFTNLVFWVDREQLGVSAKDLPGVKFRADVVVERLRPGLLSDWGYYFREALIEREYDGEYLREWNRTGVAAPGITPRYFRPTIAREQPFTVVYCDLVSVVLKDRQGAEIGRYRQPDDLREFIKEAAD